VNSTTARRLRVVGALVLSAALVGSLAACSTPSSKPTAGGTYTLWDPYPDRDASSTWAKAVDACATQLPGQNVALESVVRRGPGAQLGVG